MTPEREATVRRRAASLRWYDIQESLIMVDLIAALDAERELVDRAVPFAQEAERERNSFGKAAAQWLQDVRERGEGK